MKPIIAISPNMSEVGAISLSCAYTSAVIEAGGIPIVIPEAEPEEIKELLRKADGLILSGGGDVDPLLYGEERLKECGKAIDRRDRLDLDVLQAATELGLPVLGICRGCQVINVFFGGALYQDLPSQLSLYHRSESADTVCTHEIRVEEDTPLQRAVGDLITVNSYHHQAIKTLGEGLRVMAKSEDGIIEAITKDDYPFLRAYQWHPERSKGKESAAIFAELITAARGLKSGDEK